MHVDYAERDEPVRPATSATFAMHISAVALCEEPLACFGGQRRQSRIADRTRGEKRGFVAQEHKVERNLRLGRGLNEPHDSIREVPSFETHTSGRHCSANALDAAVSRILQ